MSKPEESSTSKLDPFEPVKDTKDMPPKTDPRDVIPVSQPRAAVVQVQKPSPTKDNTTVDDADEEDYSYIDRATD